MNVPEDILVEILSRLPVKSLIKFRCVCKSWYDILKKPTFDLKHHNSNLLVSRRDFKSNERVISLFGNENTIIETFDDQNLSSFLNGMFSHIRLIGPCKGIVCLYGFHDNIALWNPAIRDFKVLPRSQIPRRPDAGIRGGDIGVGFDSRTNDFKVMQILFCTSNDLGLVYQVEIFSLRMGLWRKYEDIVPANIMYYNVWSMVYKNEIFCWWAQDGNVEVILSFDMGKEMFQKTPLPCDIEVLGGQHMTRRAISLFKVSIALIVYHLKEVDKFFDIWVTNELGINGDSWIKLLSIGPLSQVERPLGFWNGKFMLESNCRELVLYDPSIQEIKNLGIHGKRDRVEVIVYVENEVGESEFLRRRRSRTPPTLAFLNWRKCPDLFLKDSIFDVLKELETLDILKELETNTIEELKLKLQKEILEINAALNANTYDKNVNSAAEIGKKVCHDNYMNDSLNGIGVSDLCPSFAAGFILLELKQAKLNLNRTTKDLADI
ncbi:F-box/kelch-repeat protein [Forsythia ovata]|uniref:F-box/kelch-repeat protein n=1 Tax=Forsythia ovata TaxID=205694 RepID=A0ABD1RZJ7_9LAMI